MFIPGKQRHAQTWIDRVPYLLGWLLTPRRMTLSHDLGGLPYGIDNDCYALGEAFNSDKYLRAIDRILARHGSGQCKFATAPDVVADAQATLNKAERWLPLLRSLGIPAALVAQDGLEDLPVPWDNFDALFIGGSTEWKLSQAAATLVKEAKQRGKWVHAGRVNGGARINHFWHLQADSFDGTGVAIAPQKEMSYLISKLQALSMQLSFF